MLSKVRWWLCRYLKILMLLRLTFILTFVVELRFHIVIGWMERMILSDIVVSYSCYLASNGTGG
jgi:hypothetical protein